MTPYDLFELIKENNGNTPKETIKETLGFLDGVRNDPDKFTYELEKFMEGFAEEYNCCSICGEELETNTYDESSECRGFEVNEKIYEKECPNHGCID